MAGSFSEQDAVRSGINLVEWRAYQEEARRLAAAPNESRVLYVNATRLGEVVQRQLQEARTLYVTTNTQMQQHHCNLPQP